MLFGISFGSKKLLGLDIGSSTIKLAQVDVSRKGMTLKSFGIMPTPLQSTSNGEILDPEGVAAAIQELISEVKTKKKTTAASMSGAAVIVKKITIPKMEAGLVDEHIRWEAEQYIPYDINEVNLAFEILKNSNMSSETMDILLVAAVQSSIYKIAETLQLSGLDCAVMDVSGFSLFNCFEKTYGMGSSETIAIFNMGASSTNFIVADKGDVIFCRDIPIGGMAYTNEIQKVMDVAFDEAESLKISASNGEPVPDEVTKVIESVHEIVKDEISSSLDFFLNTNNIQVFSKSFITGGASKTLGIVEALGSFIQLERFNPFDVITYDKSFSPEYINEVSDYSAVALGLAMREVGDS